MHFDTTRADIYVVDDKVTNYSGLSDYDPAKSTTSDTEGFTHPMDLTYWKTKLQSAEYYDTICVKNDKINSTVDPCIQDMSFGLINYINGTFKASGIIGLAPDLDNSIIN